MHSHVRHPRLSIRLFLWLGLALFVALTLSFWKENRVSAQSEEQQAVRLVVEKFCAAYQQKDLAALRALWSERAPDLAATQQALQQIFTNAGLSKINSPTPGQLKLESEKALVRLVFEPPTAEAKPGAATVAVKTYRNLHLVKEGASWKVWRYVAAEADLAAALLAATTQEARRVLLEAEKELVTNALCQALLAHARPSYARGEYQAAFRAYEQAQQLAEQIGDKADSVLALRGLGNVYYVQSNLAQAQIYYQRSLKLAEEISDREGILNAVNNLGNISYSQGDYRKALEYYQQSKRLAEERKDAGGLTRALNNIGSIYLLQSNYPLALETLRQTLKLAQAAGDLGMVSQALNNLGLTHLGLTEYNEALDSFQQALKLVEDKGFKPGMILALNNLAVVHEAQGKYQLAEDCYRRSMQLAEALGNKEALAFLLSNLGNTRRLQGDQRQAIELTERAIKLAKQIGNLEALSKASTRAGKDWLALGQPEQAEQAFAAAIQAVEQLRAQAGGSEQDRQRFLETRIAPYYGMIDLLVTRRQLADALGYAQRAKGRVLLDVLQGGKADVAKAMTAAEAEQEQRLKRDLATLNTLIYRERLQAQPNETRLGELNTQLEKLRLEQEAFQAGLYSAHPELKLQRGELHPLSLDEIASLLPNQQTAILEYVVAEEQTYLFVITRTAGGGTQLAATLDPHLSSPISLQVYPLKLTRAEVTDLAERFRRRIANRSFDLNELAGELYRRLLQPAHEQLSNKQALIIIPDGSLWQLPFQALQATGGRYLIEDHALAYAPSLPVLHAMFKQQVARSRSANRAPSLLAFGNPLLGAQRTAQTETMVQNGQAAPLPETERQVNALKQLYGQTRSKVLLGVAAREDVLKAEAARYRILHLATHGILNDTSPMYSHLLLSQTPDQQGEDGLLEAWEIMRLNLQTDLVVLSACETARGRVGLGEGIIGLTWAFFVAGSPANVVSQWKVESSSTADLMLEFHRQLGSRPATAKPAPLRKAEALRQASLIVLRNPRYRHPFYWASFVLIGDGR
jgi:CHAT domain-containing protein